MGVASPRTDDRRNCPCRVPAPHLHEVRRRQGPGAGIRDAVHREVPEALLPQEPGTQHFTHDDDDSVLELYRLSTVRPQERDQRHTVDQMVFAPWLTTLDVPVPQLVDVMVEVLTCIDKPSSVEQVIEVPTIDFLHRVPVRTVLR